MADDTNHAPGLATLLQRVGRTTLGALHNRAELLSVEWQEEKARLVKLLVWSLGLLVLALLAIGMITATVIVLVPEDYRVWALGGFSLLYAGGAVAAFIMLKSLLKKEPFCESIEQVRKDAVWLETSE
jgi:uncharacterized membrane protein YqjE